MDFIQIVGSASPPKAVRFVLISCYFANFFYPSFIHFSFSSLPDKLNVFCVCLNKVLPWAAEAVLVVPLINEFGPDTLHFETSDCPFDQARISEAPGKIRLNIRNINDPPEARPLIADMSQSNSLIKLDITAQLLSAWTKSANSVDQMLELSWMSVYEWIQREYSRVNVVFDAVLSLGEDKHVSCTKMPSLNKTSNDFSVAAIHFKICIVS